MPFFTDDAERIMEQSKRYLSKVEVQRVDEDLAFLKNMKEKRTFTMGSKDKTLDKIENKRAKRKYTTEKTTLKTKQPCLSLAAGCSTSYEQVSDDEEDIDFTTPSMEELHRRSKKPGCEGYWNHNILSDEEIVQTALKYNISTRALIELTKKFSKATGGDESILSLGYTTVFRYKCDAIEKIAAKVKNTWRPSATMSVHWDGKRMETLNDDFILEERVAISVSGNGEDKLLGIPAVHGKATGDAIAEKTFDLLNTWNCTEEIKSMVFDTTSVNSGKENGVCTKLQQTLQKKNIMVCVQTPYW